MVAKISVGRSSARLLAAPVAAPVAARDMASSLGSRRSSRHGLRAACLPWRNLPPCTDKEHDPWQ